MIKPNKAQKSVTLSATEREDLVADSIGMTVIDDAELNLVAGGGTRPRSTVWVDSCVKPGQQCP